MDDGWWVGLNQNRVLLRSKSLSFEFSELDLTWLWPSWPSPDLHLTWTWTRARQLNQSINQFYLDQTDDGEKIGLECTLAPDCSWYPFGQNKGWFYLYLLPPQEMNTCQDKVIGVVSSLQNAESLCLDSLSLVVINFIICSLAELETYPSPICCHTMEEQISGMRDHLWGRQSVSSVSVSGVF